MTLFERTSSEVRLTPSWRADGKSGRAGFGRSQPSQGNCRPRQGSPCGGPLRVGVIYTIAPYLLPRLIPALHARAPKMPLYIHENFTVNLSEQLRRGDIDVAIIALPFAEHGVLSRAVYDEPFCVALPVDHPLAACPTISRDQVASENLLLLGKGNCFRDQVVEACPKLSQPAVIEGSLEGSSLETVRHMVASGAGISVVPVSAAESWPQGSSLSGDSPFF